MEFSFWNAKFKYNSLKSIQKNSLNKSKSNQQEKNTFQKNLNASNSGWFRGQREGGEQRGLQRESVCCRRPLQMLAYDKQLLQITYRSGGVLPLNSPFATEKNACNKNTRSVYTKCAELVGLNELDLFPILFLE